MLVNSLELANEYKNNKDVALIINYLLLVLFLYSLWINQLVRFIQYKESRWLKYEKSTWEIGWSWYKHYFDIVISYYYRQDINCLFV